MNPAEQTELSPQVLLLQAHHETHETCQSPSTVSHGILGWSRCLPRLTKDIEHKADEPMILRKGQEVGIDKDDVLV